MAFVARSGEASYLHSHLVLVEKELVGLLPEDRQMVQQEAEAEANVEVEGQPHEELAIAWSSSQPQPQPLCMLLQESRFEPERFLGQNFDFQSLHSAL
jgi:hypothetical protein